MTTAMRMCLHLQWLYLPWRQVLLHDAANDDDVSNDEAATMATALVQEELALVYQAFLIVELTSPNLPSSLTNQPTVSPTNQLANYRLA